MKEFTLMLYSQSLLFPNNSWSVLLVEGLKTKYLSVDVNYINNFVYDNF